MLLFRLVTTVAALSQVCADTPRTRETLVVQDSALANFFYTDKLLSQFSAISRAHCMAQCFTNGCCHSFTYNDLQGAPGSCCCHGTRKLGTPGRSVSDGARTYVRDFGTVSNVAPFKPTHHSSQYPQSSTLLGPFLAVDNDLNPVMTPDEKCSSTLAEPGVRSWWQVDLEDVYRVYSIVITNRGDCCGERLRDFDLHLYDQNPMTNPGATSTLFLHYDGPMGQGVTEELLPCSPPITGRFVRLTNTKEEYLSLCEVQVMAEPASGYGQAPYRDDQV